MSSVLLTFLGRVPKDQNGYRVTRYDFGDGAPTAPSAFFGWPLQRRLGARRLVIMGTSGSMWDHLFEGDLPFGREGEEARLALVEAVQDMAVTPEHLRPLTPLLAERLGCEVWLEIIPYARDAAEQVELLRLMAAHVAGGDEVHLDVTHGFRHLPMLGVLSALHLRIVRQAQIAGIWYGAYDPDTGEAPVHNLVGLLSIADWLQALHTYDKDGDYGVIAPLIEASSQLAAAHLRQAAFYEKTNNIGQARSALRKFREICATATTDPLVNLFVPELLKRTAWVDNNSLSDRQYELAWNHLEHGDYLRAATLGFEAVVTRLVEAAPGMLDPHLYETRETVKKGWEAEMKVPRKDRTAMQQAYLDLREIRNVLAHGSRSPFGPIQKALAAEEKLKATLTKALTLAHSGAKR